MYLLLYSIIILLSLYLTKIKYRTVIKSNILFTLIWCTCAGISSIGFYGLYKPSAIIHFYSLTAIITFNIIFFIHNRNKENPINTRNIKGKARLNIIYILNFISWLYLSEFLIKALDIINSIGLKGLRGYAYDSSKGFATTFELLIIQWIIEPIFIATILIAVVYIVLGKKAPLLKIISIISVTIYTLTFGGRYLIVRVLMYYIFTLLITKSTQLKVLGKKKVNKLFIGAIILTIIILTNQRSWGESSFIESTLVYYVGSFTFLDVLLKATSNMSPMPLFGGGIFGFVYNLIVTPLIMILDLPYINSNYIITQVTSIPRMISPTQSYLAMTTMLYPFLRDFGYLGIIIGTSFLAWIISSAEIRLKRTNKLFLLCFYVYLCFVLFDSVMSYQLLFPSAGVTLLALYLFIDPQNRKID
ncbi:oligosaccharide repeat unit polymerase [Rhodococcus qingshengii]|nr:oligosaccharide repeat unit polymerase [Rhodococcus qingshengii]